MPALLLAVMLLATACFDPLNRAGSRDSNPDHVTVGSGAFPEAQIIGQIYIDALKANGFSVKDQLNSGTRERYIPALRAGDIDLVPDYIGPLMYYLAKNSKTVSKEKATQYESLTSVTDINTALHTVLGDDLTAYDYAPGSNSDSVTVTAETAKEWNLKTIADLAEKSKTESVSFMANSEFKSRSVGVAGLKEKYGLQVDFRPNNDSGGPATIKALREGKVTAADIYTTTPALLDTSKLVVLEDPLHNFPANNVIPVLAKSKNTDKLAKVLNAVSAKLTLRELQQLNNKVSGSEKVEVEDAAKQWIKAHGLDRRLA